MAATDFFVRNGRNVVLVQQRSSLAGVQMMLAGYEILPDGSTYKHIGVPIGLIVGNLAASTTSLTGIFTTLAALPKVTIDPVANAVGDAFTDAVINLPTGSSIIGTLAALVTALGQTNTAVNKNGANLNGAAANLNTIKKAVDVIAGDLQKLQDKVNAIIAAAAPPTQ